MLCRFCISERQRLVLFVFAGFLIGAAIDLAGLIIEHCIESQAWVFNDVLVKDPVDLVSTFITALLAALVGFNIALRWNRELHLELIVESSWRNLAAVIEQSPFAAVVIDQQGTVLFRNATAQAFFPDSMGVALGQPLSLLNPTPGEVKLRLSGDGIRHFQVFVGAIEWDGQSANLLSLLDITEQKDLERLREDVNRIMRHDLKGPLNGIIGVPQVLAMDDNLTPEQRELVGAIEQAGRNMLSMIDNSLDLFKMEIGTYEYEPQSVNVVGVVRNILFELEPMLLERKVTAAVTIDGAPLAEAGSTTVLAEERLLQVMLSNLILNAIEASPPGGTVGVELATSERASIVIRNRGTVPPSIREHFFEKYKSSGKRSGVGLGTYSAKLMAQTMGFEIAMDTSDAENATLVRLFAPIPAE